MIASSAVDKMDTNTFSLERQFVNIIHLCLIEIPSQGRFQDFFQGVAEISSEGGKNLPGGCEKNLAAPPSPQFCIAFLHIILLIYAHFLNIFWTHVIKKYIKYICFLFFFLFVFYILYASLVPLNILGSGGSKPP